MPTPPTADELLLTLPRGGTLTATATADTSTGAVHYAVCTAHLHGAFLVHPHTVGDELLPGGVRVSFGDGAPPVRSCQPRPHEPFAHRVRIHGTATCSTLDRPPDPRAALVEPVVLCDPPRTRRRQSPPGGRRPHGPHPLRSRRDRHGYGRRQTRPRHRRASRLVGLGSCLPWHYRLICPSCNDRTRFNTDLARFQQGVPSVRSLHDRRRGDCLRLGHPSQLTQVEHADHSMKRYMRDRK